MDKFEENEEINVDADIIPTLSADFYQFFHYVRMPDMNSKFGTISDCFLFFCQRSFLQTYRLDGDRVV